MVFVTQEKLALWLQVIIASTRAIKENQIGLFSDTVNFLKFYFLCFRGPSRRSRQRRLDIQPNRQSKRLPTGL